MEEKKFDVSVSEHDEFVLVEVSLGGPIAPGDLPELLASVQEAVGRSYFGRGVIISGRMPVWAYAALVHEFHPARWVATFDPRLAGGVVVESHDPGVRVGEVVRV